MSHLKKFLIVSTLLQVAMVLAGHGSMAIRGLSPILGTGIPILVGAWFGATAASSNKVALRDGFIIGFVGAFIGVLLAVLLGHDGWMLLTFAPLSSGVTGLIGSIVAYLVVGKKS